MKRIYLDNAATSWPKAPGVGEAMKDYIEKVGCSPGRGGYACSLEAGRQVLQTREALAGLFGVSDPSTVIFTANVTQALNYALKGLLRPGDHVLSTSMEHNAVVRPLRGMEQRGEITVDFIPCSREGDLDWAEMKKKVKHQTRALIMTHASNVTGTLLPVEECSSFARENDLLFILDAAQTAGLYPIPMRALHVNILAFTGHKGLLGPQGTGGFIVDKETAQHMTPLIEGGTGSSSDREYQPHFLPDKLESGTLNSPGLYGLARALEYIEEQSMDTLRRRCQVLAQRLWEGLDSIPELTLHGPWNQKRRTSVLSFTVEGQDLGELAYTLDQDYGIMARSGLHCAPLAHGTLGTYPQGTLRFSPGPFLSEKDMDYVVESVEKAVYQSRK